MIVEGMMFLDFQHMILLLFVMLPTGFDFLKCENFRARSFLENFKVTIDMALSFFGSYLRTASF